MSDDDPGVFQVVMPDSMRERFERWLSSGDLYLFAIPVEDDLPTYGIGLGETHRTTP